MWAAASFTGGDSKQQPCACRRQQAELVKAEAKALNEHYMLPEGMDDMGDWMEAQELDKALAAGCVQAQIGGRS